jgi:hypothetical protein
LTISRLNFADVDAADVQSLVTTGVPEGKLIEYKRETYGGKDEDVKEFLKDISSFANSGGGHLLIGVEETGGVASGISPLTSDIDKEIARLENMARDGIEPRIQAQFRAIEVAGGSVVAIRIAPSWSPPHRVSARRTNRIYVRGSSGAYEASMDELRNLFTSAASARAAAIQFRSERLAAIEQGDTPVKLTSEPSRIVLHLAPLSAFGGAPNTANLVAAQSLSHKLRPLRAMSYTPTVNFDGFLVYRGGNDCFGYTQLYRDGRIEAVKVGALASDGSKRIPSGAIESSVMNEFPGYVEALASLGFTPPYFVALTLQNVGGSTLSTSRYGDDDHIPLRQKDLKLPVSILEMVGSPEQAQAALRPAFDALWNSAGQTHCPNFTPEGSWRPAN